MDVALEKLLRRGVRYISYRDRSEKEVVDHLKKKLGKNETGSIINDVLDKLREYDLLDDKKFALNWVKSRFRRGKGPIRIKSELYTKGIDKQFVIEALGEMDKSDWLKSAAELIGKRISRWDGVEYRKKREKAFRFLIYRGFPLDVVREAIDQGVKQE